MAGSVKFFCLAASVLLLLQSADGSPLRRKSFKRQRENTSAQIDENVTDNYDNSNTNGKGKSPVLKNIKRTGSDIVQVGNNLPRLIKKKATNAKDEIVKEKKKLSKKDSNSNANIFQRKISIPAKAVNNVGIDFVANKTEKYVKKFQNEFNNRDKLTPMEEREDTISANLKRYMHNPVIVTKAVAGVAVGKIKSTKNSLTKRNNNISPNDGRNPENPSEATA